MDKEKELALLIAKIGLAGIVLAYPIAKALNEEQADLAKLFIKIGGWSTLASIPVGIWAIERWPDKTIYAAAILTAMGLGIKEYMLRAAKSQIEGDISSNHLYEQLPAPAR